MYVTDTIAAISTPVGEGGIGIVRISGPDAAPIAQKIFRRTSDGGLLSHRFYYGEIVDPRTDITIDEVLLVLMRSPRSYTREDVVEIHCHGGSLVVQNILELVLAQGARLAGPGEFTRRAFLNGRLDLAQAEAVIDIIRGKSDAALKLAQHQRQGLLSREISSIRDQLRQALALVEAYVDFPDEDLGTASISTISDQVRRASQVVERLVLSYDEGRVLRNGVSVAIVGKPNVGKSSLLNTLLQEKRAIVTAVPGTTRDIIEEVINIKGLPVGLLDTAGIRESSDLIEQEGMRLVLNRLPQADLALFILDGSRPFDEDDQRVADALAGKRFLVVQNKSDLPQVLALPPGVVPPQPLSICTASGAGIEGLKQAIHDQFLSGSATDSREFVALSKARHRDALLRCRDALAAVASQLECGQQLELLAVDLRDALAALGEVTGETTPDDILDLIFSQFCIGK